MNTNPPLSSFASLRINLRESPPTEDEPSPLCHPERSEGSRSSQTRREVKTLTLCPQSMYHFMIGGSPGSNRSAMNPSTNATRSNTDHIREYRVHITAESTGTINNPK
jgi:hypothetical protein